MFDKEFWDKAVPDGSIDVIQRVCRITSLLYPHEGVRFSGFLGDCLRWLADAYEPYFPSKERVEWYTKLEPWERVHMDTPPNITCSGLIFKGEDRYLTNEGWMAGTECWYVLVEAGYHVFCCAETPELAVFRGIIMIDSMRQYYSVPPDQRRNLHELVGPSYVGTPPSSF